MGGIYNPGESIINNYLHARALRHQFEQDKLQQQNTEIDRQERIRQFDEMMKRYEEDRKLNQQARDIASKQLELQVRDRVAEGRITPDVGDIPVFERLNKQAEAYPVIPQTQLQNARAFGYEIPYAELPKITLPELKQMEWQSDLDRALAVAEANAKARADTRANQDLAVMQRAQLQAKTSKENTADLIKSREKIAGMRTAGRATDVVTIPAEREAMLGAMLRFDPSVAAEKLTKDMWAKVPQSTRDNYVITETRPDGSPIPGVTGRKGIGILRNKQMEELRNFQGFRNYVVTMRDFADSIRAGNLLEAKAYSEVLKQQLPVWRETLKGLGVLSDRDIQLLESGVPSTFDVLTKTGFDIKFRAAQDKYKEQVMNLLQHLPEGHRNYTIYHYNLDLPRRRR